MRIAVVFWFNQEEGHQVFRGLVERAGVEDDCQLVPVDRDAVLRSPALAHRLRAECDAAILVGGEESRPQLARLLALPLLTTAWVGKNSGCSQVVVDAGRTCAMAIDHLQSRGYRRLALLAPAQAVHLHAAFRRACHRQGVEAMRLPGPERGRQATGSRWLQELDEPLGVLAWTAAEAARLLTAIDTAGLRPGIDVAVMAIGESSLITGPRSLTSIALPWHAIGEAAVAVIRAHLADGRPRIRRLLPLAVIARDSTLGVGGGDLLVAWLCRQLAADLGQPLSIAGLVRSAGVARRTLEYRCRRALGHGIAAERTRLRLAQAKRLLTETRLPIKAVALAIGHRRLDTFSRFFRRHLGMTPSRWRDC